MSMVTSKNIRLNLTVAVMVFWLAPLFAQANWYWLTIPEDPELGDVIELSPTEYAITAINKLHLYRLEDELVTLLEQTRDSEACVDEYEQVLEELWEYDTTNKPTTSEITYLQDLTGNRISSPEVDIITNEEFVTGRDQLLRNTDVQLQRCLDDAEEKATKEARTKEITEAVQSCDLNFLDSMTTPEKMDTYEEREACKTKQEVMSESEPVVKDIVPVELVEEIVSIAAPVNAVSTPEPTRTNNPTTTTRPQGTSVESDPLATSSNDVPEAVESPTDQDTLLMEPIIEQMVDEEKPTLFQRVIRFFTGWFN